MTTFANWPCPTSAFCPEGSRVPTYCPIGTYQPLAGQAACLACPSGFFCGVGAAAYEPCPRGHYCGANTEAGTQFPCPNGTFSNATRLQAAAECTPCLPGHFCNDTGLEAPGHLRAGPLLRHALSNGTFAGLADECLLVEGLEAPSMTRP